MGSWVHAELPTGGSLDITSLSAYLNSSNDAPNFVFELIRSSPTMLIVVLDLPPRKDLVLWPDYLKTFYEDTKLDTYRQDLEKIPEVQPYVTASLFIRTVASPTAIFLRIQTENVGERIDEIIRDHIDLISKQVLGIWLDHCACAEREVGEEDKAYLRKRDGVIRNKTIEVDLGSSFPRLFGPEAAKQILEAIKEYFTI
jgi:red chlorophyll catabolite reductase